jgi:hypothetical protein
MMPEMKFDTMFCSPKPMPTDSAPATMASDGQVDAGRGDRHQRGEEDAEVAHARDDGPLAADLDLGLGQDGGFERALHQLGQHVAEREDHDEGQEIGGREPRLADHEALAEARPELPQVGGARAPEQREDRQRHRISVKPTSTGISPSSASSAWPVSRP